jgi:hypothetical protein
MNPIIILLFMPLIIPAYATNEWNDSCFDSGFRDGQDNPFSQPTWDHCGDEEGGDDAYYDGFIKGCMSVEGNTKHACELATDAG